MARPSEFHRTGDGEIQEPLKNGSNKEKQESLNTTVTQPSNRWKPVHKDVKITILFCIFGEKKHKKS